MRSVKDLFSLEGKVAAITGGAGHLGIAMAEALAEQGASIALIDVNEHSIALAAERLCRQYATPVIGLAADLALNEDVLALPHRVYDQFGNFHILINNAGFVGTSGLPGWVTDFAEQSTETWRKALEVNLTAPFTLCRESTPYLKAAGGGTIINVGSIYGVLGPDMRLYEGTAMGNPAAYAASKGGLLQLTRWLSTVLAPDVRVNSIIPGGIWRNQPEKFVERYIDRTPLQRMGTEEDFKGVVAWLASDASAYVTGQNITIDGGWSAW